MPTTQKHLDKIVRAAQFERERILERRAQGRELIALAESDPLITKTIDRQLRAEAKVLVLLDDFLANPSDQLVDVILTEAMDADADSRRVAEGGKRILDAMIGKGK